MWRWGKDNNNNAKILGLQLPFLKQLLFSSLFFSLIQNLKKKTLLITRGNRLALLLQLFKKQKRKKNKHIKKMKPKHSHTENVKQINMNREQ